jgi:microcystin-dependent protein
MAQHDYDIANQTFPNFRTDLNNVLQAILTNNSGGTAPTVTAAGMIWIDTSGATPVWKVRNTGNTAWESFTNVTVPSGTIWEYGGASAPDGWLICNGAQVSRSTYANLFAVIGTAYGVGDGSTTFNLPNRVDRVGVGAGVLFARGQQGGGYTTDGTALTTAQIPSHTHTGTTSTTGDHTHTLPGDTLTFSNPNGVGGGGAPGFAGSTTNAAGSHNHTFTTDATGSGATHSHTFTPPFVASNYIIKV